MVHLFTINAEAQSGKSSFIQYCSDFCNTFPEEKKLLVFELSTVDFVKEVARFCGWNGEKTAKNRKFLSDLKFLLRDWANIPINKVFENIEKIVSEYSDRELFVFINSREPEDQEEIYNRAKENGYSISKILVKRKDWKSNEVPELIKGIYSIKYDIILHNDESLDEWKETANLFIQSYL